MRLTWQDFVVPWVSMLSKYQAWQQLKLVEQSEQQSFEEFAMTMRDPNVVSVTHDFLQSIPVETRHGLNARIFLSSLLLARFPSETMSSERNELEETVYQMALRMVELLDKDHLSLERCDVTFHNFVSCFKIWLKQDREDLVQLMAKVHRQIRSFDDSIPPDESQRVLERIETVADSIAGEQGVEQVKTASQYGLAEADIIASQVAQQMKRAFWDLLRRDLSADPPNFTQYPGLVEDTRSRIVRLLPTQNLAQTTEYVNTNLNSELIAEQIKSGTYTLQDIYNTLVFVLKRVRELGPASEDEAVATSIQHIHTEMKPEEGTPVNLAELIPKVFQEALERLDTIGFTKDAIREEVRKHREAQRNQATEASPASEESPHVASKSPTDTTKSKNQNSQQEPKAQQKLTDKKDNKDQRDPNSVPDYAAHMYS